jgi:uncharacterized protein (DUF2141 family)
MKIIIFFLFCMIVIPVDSFSQFKLEIEIQEIRNNKGKIMLQFFNENEKLLTQEMGLIEGNKCSFSIPDLKPGKYAVRYYHDENTNGKMETNLVGKPTEGYGFSNNVTSKYGAPPFAKWLFEIKDDKKIILKPTY